MKDEKGIAWYFLKVFAVGMASAIYGFTFWAIFHVKMGTFRISFPLVTVLIFVFFLAFSMGMSIAWYRNFQAEKKRNLLFFMIEDIFFTALFYFGLLAMGIAMAFCPCSIPMVGSFFSFGFGYYVIARDKRKHPSRIRR